MKKTVATEGGPNPSRTQRTCGQIEAEISEAIVQFEKEYMGRGPLEVKTYVIDDMVLVRLTGILTKAEHHLANTENGSEGRELIKKTRQVLLEKGRPLLEAVIQDILRCKVRSLHTDISTVTGERIILFVLERSSHEKPGLTD
jgi:uncharacterized protein YbcI